MDLVLFLGKEKLPEEVTRLYHEYINGWAMMPFWSFGYHQSRFGVRNLDGFKEIVETFEKNDLPLDGKSRLVVLSEHRNSLLERY